MSASQVSPMLGILLRMGRSRGFCGRLKADGERCRGPAGCTMNHAAGGSIPANGNAAARSAATAAATGEREASRPERAGLSPRLDGRPALCELRHLRDGDIVRIPGMRGNQRVIGKPMMFPERFDLHVASVDTDDRTNVGQRFSSQLVAERLPSPDSVGLSGRPVRLDSGEWGVLIDNPPDGLAVGDVAPCEVTPRSASKAWMQQTEIKSLSNDHHGHRVAYGRKAASETGAR